VKVVHAVGARPNFMKIAPIMRELATRPDDFQQILVHTGQHYDDNMSSVFFGDLELPHPDEFLGAGSGSHAQQTAFIMRGFEPVLSQHRPDWVIVVGDVNSTLACALTAVKLGIRVAHVEAGLRSFDRTMPEEHNRVLTDRIADLLFTHSPEASENLLREATPPERIHFVGNVMIDTLVRLLPKTQGRLILADLGLVDGFGTSCPGIEPEGFTARPPAAVPYVLVHFLPVVALVETALLLQDTAPFWVLAGLALQALVAGSSFAALFEGRRWWPALEIARLATLPLVWYAAFGPYPALVAAALAVGSLPWMIRHRE
jgi:hypothetical protein